ncbi:DUF1203 domain-containing protein [Tabrizicola flagellatus]|uniref:DUF1203 domain-containing protein n=1 Tax=Tabrizicola flagellatus TaxID=2593021 RepID=UPI0011F1E6A7|nr:DUF1203 domain-containing protein [Tabrizicola flagellatus]
MRFLAIPTDQVRQFQAGGADANGQVPERKRSEGDGNPCRHCLRMIPEGAGMLVLAYRPFPALQPYAEVGPIFLCADPCAAGGGAGLPEMLAAPDYILRGYGNDDRIVYGTGGVVATAAIPARAAELLADARVAYLHVRSARNNCYQCRIERA